MKWKWASVRNWQYVWLLGTINKHLRTYFIKILNTTTVCLKYPYVNLYLILIILFISRILNIYVQLYDYSIQYNSSLKKKRIQIISTYTHGDIHIWHKNHKTNNSSLQLVSWRRFWFWYANRPAMRLTYTKADGPSSKINCQW